MNGAELRRRRASMGYSQVSLAKAADLSRATIAGLEGGRQRPSATTEHTLRNLLDWWDDDIAVKPTDTAPTTNPQEIVIHFRITLEVIK